MISNNEPIKLGEIPVKNATYARVKNLKTKNVN